MQIRNRKLTGMQAAEQFAALNWGHPRHIGETDNRGYYLRFKLIDGKKWYVVSIDSHGFWTIEEEATTDPAGEKP